MTTAMNMSTDMVITPSAGSVTLSDGDQGVTLSPAIKTKLKGVLGGKALPNLPGDGANKPLNMHRDSETSVTRLSGTITINGPVDGVGTVTVKIFGTAYGKLTSNDPDGGGMSPENMHKDKVGGGKPTHPGV